MERRLANPVGQRRAVQLQPQPRVDLRLAIEAEGGRRTSRSAHAPGGPRSAGRPRSATPAPAPAPPRRPCTGCRRSAGEPSRSPRTGPARCPAVRCGPRRSSSSRRSRTGKACWRARSPPSGARYRPGTGPPVAATAADAVLPPRPARPPPARRRLPTPPSRDRRTKAGARPRPASPTSCRTEACEARR